MNKKGLWILILLSFFILQAAGDCFSAELTIQSEEQLSLAQEAMDRGEYERAVVELERFLHFFPRDEQAPRARYLIGLCYLKARRYEKAREVLEAVHRDYRGSRIADEALFSMAESYYRQELQDEAGRLFQQVIDQSADPEIRNRAAYRLGWCRMRLDRWKDASETFRQVEPASPLFPKARDLSEKSLQGETLPSKDPATAGIMAGILPGLGHAYCERYKDGVVAFLLNGLFIWAAYESFHQDHDVLGGILAFLELGWYSGNIYSAVNSAHKYNRSVKNDFLRSLRDDLEVGFFGTPQGQVGMAFQLRF